MESPEEPHREGEVTPASGRDGPASPLIPVVEAGAASVAIQALGGSHWEIARPPGASLCRACCRTDFVYI